MERVSLGDLLLTIDQSPLEPRLREFLKKCFEEAKNTNDFSYEHFGFSLMRAEEADRPVLTVFIRALVQQL